MTAATGWVATTEVKRFVHFFIIMPGLHEIPQILILPKKYINKTLYPWVEAMLLLRHEVRQQVGRDCCQILLLLLLWAKKATGCWACCCRGCSNTRSCCWSAFCCYYCCFSCSYYVDVIIVVVIIILVGAVVVLVGVFVAVVVVAFAVAVGRTLLSCCSLKTMRMLLRKNQFSILSTFRYNFASIPMIISDRLIVYFVCLLPASSSASVNFMKQN